jgi:regulator of RNase E activity RraA
VFDSTMAATNGSLVERYCRLSTCVVSDAMDQLGIRRGGCVGILPLEPSTRIAGPAFTVRFVPKAGVPAPLPEYMDKPRPGDVVVIANSGRLDCSGWGDLRSLAAQQRGLAGTVVDGAYRDVEEQRSIGYPVFGRSAIMANTTGVVALAAVNEPVEIAGVPVRPGDFILADASGVLVIPAADVDRVLEAAERHAAVEERIVAAIRGGMSFEQARRAHLPR